MSTIREKRALREKTNEKADMKVAQIELVKLQHHVIEPDSRFS